MEFTSHIVYVFSCHLPDILVNFHCCVICFLFSSFLLALSSFEHVVCWSVVSITLHLLLHPLLSLCGVHITYTLCVFLSLTWYTYKFFLLCEKFSFFFFPLYILVLKLRVYHKYSKITKKSGQSKGKELLANS